MGQAFHGDSGVMSHAIGRWFGIRRFGAMVEVGESGMRRGGSRAAATSGTNFHKDIYGLIGRKGL